MLQSRCRSCRSSRDARHSRRAGRIAPSQAVECLEQGIRLPFRNTKARNSAELGSKRLMIHGLSRITPCPGLRSDKPLSRPQLNGQPCDRFGWKPRVCFPIFMKGHPIANAMTLSRCRRLSSTGQGPLHRGQQGQPRQIGKAVLKRDEIVGSLLLASLSARKRSRPSSLQCRRPQMHGAPSRSEKASRAGWM